MRICLIALPLLVWSCNGETIAPAMDAVTAASGTNGAQLSTYMIDVPVDHIWEPSDFPCFSEPVRVFGTVKEHFIVVVNPSEGWHVTIHQATNNLSAVGLTTGDRYAVSGPLTITQSGNVDRGGLDPIEFTFHNINHLVGPGPDANVFFRTLIHATIDPATGASKAEVIRDDVLCH